MAKKKRQGHYCKICDQWKANEKFSGKGHAAHICKSCQSLSSGKQADMINNRNIDEIFEKGHYDIHDYTDIDCLPVFSEQKKFKELDNEYKALLREYIHRETTEYIATHEKVPTENELTQIRKRMVGLFEEEYHIILKNDAILRQFFQDNVTTTINRLQKRAEGSHQSD